MRRGRRYSKGMGGKQDGGEKSGGVHHLAYLIIVYHFNSMLTESVLSLSEMYPFFQSR